MNLEELKKVQNQLKQFVGFFKQELRRKERSHWCHMYLCGLMLNGERKSIQPMSERLPGGNEQAMQQFVNQSSWDHCVLQTKLGKYLARELNTDRGVLILDDTSLPKKGDKSVGVARQYCGSLGKVANCQSIVSWHYAQMGKEHFPVIAELFLPQNWTKSKERMNVAKVPERRFQFQKKWEIALELLDKVPSELTYEALVFDAGYGEVREFLGELDKKEKIFVAQIPESHSFWPLGIETTSRQMKLGRPRKYPSVKNKNNKPLSAKKWKDLLIEKETAWIKCPLSLKSKQEADVLVTRVKEVTTQAFYRPGKERWLIIEKVGEKEYKYYISNAPEDTPIEQMVAWAHERWKVEQNYQQLKEELGMDHFEGRSWRGLHHHIVLCFMAYAFLVLLKKQTGGKKFTNFACCEKNDEPSV